MKVENLFLVGGIIIVLILSSFLFGYSQGKDETETKLYKHFEKINMDGQVYQLNRSSDYCIYPEYYPIDYKYIWMQICMSGVNLG